MPDRTMIRPVGDNFILCNRRPICQIADSGQGSFRGAGWFFAWLLISQAGSGDDISGMMLKNLPGRAGKLDLPFAVAEVHNRVDIESMNLTCRRFVAMAGFVCLRVDFRNGT